MNDGKVYSGGYAVSTTLHKRSHILREARLSPFRMGPTSAMDDGMALHILHRSRALLPLVLIGLLLSGTKACQEDYELGAQSNASPTPSPCDPDVEDCATATPTKTPTVTPTASPTGTPTASPTATPSATPTPDTGGLMLRKILTEAERETATLEAKGAKRPTTSGDASGSGVANPGNWLGRSYLDREEIAGASRDSDHDGYTDLLEADFGTNVHDATSKPPPPRSRLQQRLAGVDADLDGVRDDEERRIGTNPALTESDGDGASDHAEVLSGTDPLRADSRPSDIDGDGLSDSYEAGLGTNMQSRDTDADGASDAEELAVGSSPLRNDSDGDGVLDGEELQNSADPILPER